MHRYVMHRRIDVFALRAIYERHTREHHQYFTDSDYTIDSASSQQEFRIVFFPWRVLAVLAVGGSVLGWLTAQVLNANAGYIVCMTMVGHHMTTAATCRRTGWWPTCRWSTPFAATTRRTTTRGIMMHRNMNLTLPIADCLMQSSDLDRGLLGPIFNGYSEKHVREKLRPIIACFKADDSRVTLDGPRLTPNEERVVA